MTMTMREPWKEAAEVWDRQRRWLDQNMRLVRMASRYFVGREAVSAGDHLEAAETLRSFDSSRFVHGSSSYSRSQIALEGSGEAIMHGI